MPTSDTPANAALPGKFAAEWPDGTGRTWHIEADAERIVLASGEDVLDLPRAVWTRDMSLAPHAGGYIIRFETFDQSVGFLVSGEQGAPLLAVLGARAAREQEAAPATESAPQADTPAESRAELLWPKVSPLAVWALICSAPAFIPLLGLPFAAASIVLLLLHRRKVRRSAAWRHSRRVCAAAVCFLVAGLVVSALATGTILRKAGQRARQVPAQLQNATTARTGNPGRHRLTRSPVRPAANRMDRPYTPRPHDDSTMPAASGQSETELHAGFFDEEHNWGLIAAALVVVLLSLTIHEGAHAISAWWLGDDFARRLGRVTLNPLAHIDPIGTVVLPLILFLAGAGVFGWARPVPVRTELLPNPRRAHIWIALAGPGSNLLLAAASLLLLIGIACTVGFLAPQAMIENLSDFDYAETVRASGFAAAPLVGAVCTVLKLSFFINTLLAFFNLIPVPPLDGSWVLEHSFPRTIGPIYARLRPYAFLIFLGLLYSHILKYLLLPAGISLLVGLELVGFCTPF